MKEKIKKLIKYFEGQKKWIVNTDELTWDDIGLEEDAQLEEPFCNFKDINDYLENGGDSEFDEGQQTELRMINEFLDKLKGVIK